MGALLDVDLLVVLSVAKIVAATEGGKMFGQGEINKQFNCLSFAQFSVYSDPTWNK